jgi:O-antigen/teichoic acid export membrane protein
MLAVLIVGQSLMSFHFGMLPALRRIPLLLVVTMLQPLLELALVLAVRANGGGAAAMLTATAASALCVATVGWIVLLLRRPITGPGIPVSEEPVATMNNVLHYGRRIFFVTLLIALFGQIDQFLLGWLKDPSVVAPYALVIKLQALVAAVAITITGIVAPRIAGAGRESLAMYRQWLVFLAVLQLGAALVLAVLAPQVFGAINPAYTDDALVLVAMAPFLLLASIAPLPSVTLNQTGHAASRLRVALITLAVNIILDLALIPSLGVYGAVIATTVAFSYYVLRHHQLLTAALTADADPHTPRVHAELVRGVIVALSVTAIAVLIRTMLENVTDGSVSDVTIVLVAGGAAAIIHLWWTSRIIRRPPLGG